MPSSQEVVNILITAEDKASKALHGVSSSMDEVATKGGGLASALGGVGKVLGGFALGAAVTGIGALGAALVSGVGDAREAAIVMAQTEAVIKSTGGAAGVSAQQISDMAGSLSAASGKSLFGDDDIQRGENMLLTFTNIKDTLPETTQVMVDLAQATGTDMKGAALQLGKALNDPIKGISALSRVGVSFTKEQQKQIKAMTEAGNVAGAQKVILAELNKEFGGSAKAAAEADGGFAQFKDSMGELGESLGRTVLPLVTDFFRFLNSDAVMGTLNNMVTGFGNIVNAFQAGGLSGGLSAIMTALGTFGTNVLTWIGEQVPKIAEALVGWAGAFVGWIGPKIPDIITGLGGIITAIGSWVVEQVPILANQLLAWGQGFIDWIAPKIPDILAALAGLASSVWGWITAQVPTIISTVAGWGSAFIQWVPQAVTQVQAALPGIWTAVSTWIGQQVGPILTKLGEWAQAFIDWVIPAIPRFLAAVGAFAVAMGTAIIQAIPTIAEKVKLWVNALVDWVQNDAWPKLQPKLVQFGNDVATEVGKGVDAAKQAGTNVGHAVDEGLGQGLNENLPQTITAWSVNMRAEMEKQQPTISQKLKDIILASEKAMEDALLSSSTGTITKWGAEMSSQIANLGPNLFLAAAALGDKLGNGLIAAINHAIELYTPAAQQLGIGLTVTIATAIGDNLFNIGVAVGKIAALINEKLGGIPGEIYSKALEIGQSIQNGIIAGLAGLAFRLGVAIANALASAMASAKSSQKINSPSQLWAEEVGAPIAQGIAQGIIDNAALINAAIGEGVRDAMDKPLGNADLINAAIGAGVADALDKPLGNADLINAAIGAGVADAMGTAVGQTAAAAVTLTPEQQQTILASWKAVADGIDLIMIDEVGRLNHIVGLMLDAITSVMDALATLAQRIRSMPKVDTGGTGNGSDTGYKAPGFASGVTNFAGGLAYVHRGELLMNLPPGTSVIPAGGMGGGVFNITINAPSGDPGAISQSLVSTLRSRGVR